MLLRIPVSCWQTYVASLYEFKCVHLQPFVDSVVLILCCVPTQINDVLQVDLVIHPSGIQTHEFVSADQKMCSLKYTK